MFEFQIGFKGISDSATAPECDMILTLVNVALPISSSLAYHSHMMLQDKSFVKLNQVDISVILQTKHALHLTRVWQRWWINEKLNNAARKLHATNPV